MSKSLKTIRQQRRGYRLNIANQKAAFNEICEGNQPPEEQIQRCQSLIEVVSKYNEQIENLNSAILDAIDENDDKALDDEGTDIANFREEVHKLIQQAENRIFRQSSLVRPSQMADDDRQSSVKSVKNIIKLPKMEIPKYDGDPLQWQEFWDCFNSTVHSKEDIPEIDKFKFLKEYLVDNSAAKDAVAGYRVIESNYPVVINLLKERFGNEQIAINAHFEKLLEIPTSSEGTKSFHSVYDACERHIRSLVALGLDESTFGQVFTPIILSKLPRSARLQLHRQNGSSPWTLSRLRELMRDEIRARDWSDHYDSKSKPASQKPEIQVDKYPKKGGYNGKPGIATQSALVNNSSKPKELRCAFCGDSHFADHCPKFTTVAARRSALKSRCFKCLGEKHGIKSCKSKKICFFCKSKGHHTSLCLKKFPSGEHSQPAVEKKAANVSASGNADTSPVMAVTSPTKTRVQMQMATVHFKKHNVKARIMFDTASSSSYISQNLARKLQCKPIGQETSLVATFNETHRKEITNDTTSIAIPIKNGLEIMVDVLITDTITCPLQKYPVNISDHPILKSIVLADSISDSEESVEIDVLIGGGDYYRFIGRERIDLSDGIILLESVLGYIVTGKFPVNPGSEGDESLLLHPILIADTQIAPSNADFEKSWALDEIGIKDCPYSKDDDTALERFNETVQFRDGRYEVGLPFISDDPHMSSNYGQAYGRLRSLFNRVRQSEKTLQLYNDTIQNQLNNSVIEVADADAVIGKSFYLPHHCVINESRTTTKLRIVYDGSASSGKSNPSLNESLFRGPVMLHDLCGMLLRFRLHCYVVSSDIEKAFLQVVIRKEHRDFTRFLWLRNIHKPVDPSNIIVFRFCRVLFGLNCSPFLLAATIQHHLQRQENSFAKDIADNTYVDNVIHGYNDLASVKQFYSEAKKQFGAIGMNVREWYSNSDLSNIVKPEDMGSSSSPKVLGLSWNSTEDVLSSPNLPVVPNSESISTKRQLLQVTSLPYDPCGIICPVTVKGKMLVQDTWKQKLRWDERLPTEIVSQIPAVVEDLLHISDVYYPRIINDLVAEKDVRHEIHCFVDASEKVYAAAIYLRTVNIDGKSSTGLLFAKARLAPLKTVTIPRLELMAAVIGSRLIHFVGTQLRLSISATFLWTDAKCVLGWIHTQKLLPVFVQNRIKELRSSTDIQFRYVPSLCNPADIPTKGMSVTDLANCSLWWHGPQFLTLGEAYWPENSISETEIEPVAKLEATNVAGHQQLCGIGVTIEATKFSDLTRLLRVTSYVMRFIDTCKKRRQSTQREVTATELQIAESQWIKFAQADYFQGADPKTMSTLKHLGLYEDSQGLVRCRGRLEHADIDNQPVFLPKRNHFTLLVIRHHHNSLFHAGVRQTLASVREYFWVPQGSSTVSKVVRCCQLCRLNEGGFFRTPEFPPLPWYRVSKLRPFSYSGVDYFGPLFIKTDSGTQKVWICLFTCSATRAVHLEVVSDLSAEHFVMALRRFCAARGPPRLLISDNGKQFVATNKMFKTLIQSDQVQRHAASVGFEWKFITELSPWMGGFYERLVGTIKRSMKKALGKKCLTHTQLQTFLSEVASVVNSRPLVANSVDVGEKSLTPGDFLQHGGIRLFPTLRLDHDDDEYHSSGIHANKLRESWLVGEKVLNDFWLIWRNEYLASLRERKPLSLNNRGSSEISPTIGTVVLVKDQLPRCHWKIGRITHLHSSSDGKIRSTTISLPGGKSLNRPLRLLYPIEVPETETESKPEPSDEDGNRQKSYPARIKRAAASDALEKIRHQLQESEDSSEE